MKCHVRPKTVVIIGVANHGVPLARWQGEAKPAVEEARERVLDK